MKSIKSNILISFGLAALLNSLILGVIVSWKLNTSISRQSAELAADMTARMYATLNLPHQTFDLLVRGNIQHVINDVCHSKTLAINFDAKQYKPMESELYARAAQEGFHFAVIFNAKGQVDATFPGNLSELELERVLQRWKFGQQILQTIQTGADSTVEVWDSLLRFTTEELQAFGGIAWDLSGKGTIGIVAAGLIKNDFAEPLGFCVLGRFLNGYTAPLEQLHNIANYASLITLDSTPVIQRGFLPDVAATSALATLQLPQALQAAVYQSSAKQNQLLTLANETYFTSCSALKSFTQQPLGVFCVGLPESQITALQGTIVSSGKALTRTIYGLMSLMGLFSLGLLGLIALVIANQIVTPLKQLAAIASKIAVGDLSGRINLYANNELGLVANAFREMIAYIQDIALTAQRVSVGEIYDVYIKPRSPHDVLNQAFTATIQYIQEVAGIAEKISRKELQVDVRPKSEQDVLNRSLQQMVTNLQEMMQEIQHSMASVQQLNWVRTGQNELHTRIRGEQSIAALARQIVAYLATYLNAQAAAMYLVNADRSALTFAGGYAYTDPDGRRRTIAMGDGFVGQAALTKQRIVFTEVPANYLPIHSGLGATAPAYLLVTPFLEAEQVNGVLEFAAVHAFSTLEMEFLDQVLESIGIAIHSAEVRKKMHELLEETQRQAEELLTQQEQLTTTNLELELQAAALESKNRELERSHQEIEQKARDLELANKYKSEFLANVSHELRTPLNSTLILAKLLMDNKERNLTEKQVKSAQTIYSSGSDLLTLINDILDLSKVEAGKLLLYLEDMPLTGLGQYITQHFQHVAEQKGLYLRVELAADVPEYIQTDRQRVEQIVKNFLSNAFKFTHQGGVTVNLGRPAPGARLKTSGFIPEQAVAMTVTDTGIGISAEKQQMIFEAFQQADGSTSRKYGGTGLGLSISRQLAVLLGGEIQVQSEEGQGSTFTLYLPEKQGGTGSSAGALTGLPSQANPPDIGVDAIRDDRHEATPTDAFVLIIEPEPKLAKRLFDAGRGQGFKCLLARDGAAGLQLAYQYPLAAIVLDRQLPDFDAQTMLKRLESEERTLRIPMHLLDRAMAVPDEHFSACLVDDVTMFLRQIALAQTAAAPESPRHSPAEIPLAGKTVLLVDDDMRNVFALMNVLEEQHISVLAAENGQKALELLAAQPEIELVLMDIMMPDMDGYETMRQIRRQERWRTLPIIALTAKTMKGDRQKCLEAGANEYLSKPVDIDKLMALLHVWLYQ